MQKLTSIIFSFLILIQSFNIKLEDFSSLQALMQHAEYHQQMYGDTFIEFLIDHYGENKLAHQNEHNEHQSLPFHDNHQMCSHLNVTFINNSFYTFTFNVIDDYNTSYNFLYKDTFSKFEKPSVFQPPKHT
jgi:hypothetical protein